MSMAKQKYEKQRGVAVLKRPLYTAGLLLEDDDLTAAVEYTRNISKLLFRSLFGCGVICGLDVTARLTCNRTRIEVTVSPGIALDCEGNPIHVPKAFKVTYDAKCDPVPTEIWVTICYVQQCCGPRDTSCSADDEGRRVQTRVIDGFEVRLYPDHQPSCACSCLEPPDEPAGEASPCCDDEEADAAAAQTAQAQSTRTAQSNAGHASGYGAAGDAEPPICKCFLEHWKGTCECECCCCNCVFIGMVNVELDSGGGSVAENQDANPELLVSRDGVRWIRPMLVGYYKCGEHPLPSAAPPPVFLNNAQTTRKTSRTTYGSGAQRRT